MRVVAHLQRRIPRPSAALEAPGCLLASGSVEAVRALTRRTVPGVRAPPAIQAGARSARVDFREVSCSASAFRVGVDPDADQRRLVSVHHVRQRVYLEHVRATTLAVHVLVQAFVDAHHGDVYTHVLFNLNRRKIKIKINSQR